LLGIVLALASSACFAAQMTLTAASLRSVSPAAVLWITTVMNFLAVAAWAVATGGGHLGATAWANLMVAGLFAPLLGRAFQIGGLRALGSNVSTPILMTHPAVTVALAMTLLGERPGIAAVIGGALVIAGSAIVGRQAGAIAGVQRAPTNRLAVLLPVCGALAYGVSMIFRKIAINAGADPATAAAATIAPSCLAYTGYFALSGRSEAFRCARGGLPMLVASSAFASVAAVLWFASVAHAPLASVAPLAATTPLFALLLAFLFLRGAENFSVPVVLGTAISVAGVALTVFGAS
jgi:drug/metabolite transporter (DMT)-like permease